MLRGDIEREQIFHALSNAPETLDDSLFIINRNDCKSG
jgi:hypothetical protein